MTAVSVVLTTYQDDQRLELTLTGYAAQSATDFEIIVVNDGGQRPGGVDPTHALVERFHAQLDVHYLYLEPESEQFRLAAARNLGIRQAHGTTLLISDGDCVPHPDLIQVITRYARDDRLLLGIRKRIALDTVATLTTADVPNLANLVWQDDERLTRMDVGWRQLFLGLKDTAPPDGWQLCWGCLFAAPLWKVKALGGFDERFVSWGGEDQDLAERLIRGTGCRMYSLPEAVVYHLEHPARDNNLEPSRVLLTELRKNFLPVRNGGSMLPRPGHRTGERARSGLGKPQKISLCMIAKNEETNLAPCLISVADLVDEMIVVDTGSTDRTKELAAAFGARVFDFAWVDSFAAARNESLRHARGDWILWLDGDEYFNDDNRSKLRALFAGLQAEKAAYVMKQRSAPQHAGSSETLVDQVRLFRNRPEIRWRYRVHEQILPAIRTAGHDVRFTDICLEHTGYTDAALLGRKSERNLRLLHLQEAEYPDDPFTLFNLGWVYQDLGQSAQALPYLRRSLAVSQPGDSIVRKLYVLVAQAHRSLGQQRHALAACRAGKVHCPDDPELLFLEGQLLREQGDPAGAEQCLRQLLHLQPGRHFASLDTGVRGVKAHHQLAWVCWEQGRATEAETAWREVLAEQPRFTPAWQGLGEIYLAQGRWAELEEAAGHLQADQGHALDGTLLRARGHLARKELGPAQQLLEEASAHQPRALAPRVVLSHVLLQSQNPAAAEPVLRALVALDPGQAEAWRNLAVLLHTQQRFHEVLRVCQTGLQHCPGEPHLLRLHSMAHQHQMVAHPNPENGFQPLANDRLRLAFASFSPFSFTVETPYRQPLGGSESALCYLAEALAQQGHEVFLLHGNQTPAACRGVQCLPLSVASLQQVGPLDALIVQNLAGKGPELRALLSPRAALVFWSQHAHDQPAVQALHDPTERQAYDRIVCVSDWQRQQFLQQFDLDPERTLVLRNAISPAFSALFADNTPILARKTQPPVLAYTSTPFRGLDLLLDAFPRIRAAVPSVTLKVFSSMQVYQVAEAEEQPRYGALYRRCRETEGVAYLGSLPQPELADQLRTVSVLAYPNTFAETSCIAVLDALASGCHVITSDRGALPETCAGCARLIPTNGDGPGYLNRFVEETIRILHELTAADTVGAEGCLRRQVEQIKQSSVWPQRASEWVTQLLQHRHRPRPIPSPQALAPKHA